MKFTTFFLPILLMVSAAATDDRGEDRGEDRDHQDHRRECKVKYELWTSGRKPYKSNDLIPGATIDHPPCNANIEAVVDCGDKGIRSHVTIELHSRHRGRIQARGENLAPYFLYGNNGGSNKHHDLDVFKGDIPSKEGKEISYYLTTNVNGIGHAHPYKTEFSFRGRCKDHHDHDHHYDHGRDGHN